jgi:hypothetical protein
LKSSSQTLNFLGLLLLKLAYALFIKMLGSCYSKKTLILGTFRIIDDEITYTDIEKDVVHRLFGFPVLTHAGKLTDDDWKRIIS